MDFLNKNMEYTLNYKEFIEWFAFKKLFQMLRNPNNKFYTGQKRLLAGFKLLGLRLSRYNLNQTSERYDVQANDTSVNAWTCF